MIERLADRLRRAFRLALQKPLAALILLYAAIVAGQAGLGIRGLPALEKIGGPGLAVGAWVLWNLLWTFVGAGLLHGAARLLGARGPFRETWKALLIIGASVALLRLVSSPVPGAGFVWFVAGVIATVLAVQEIYALSPGRALAAALIAGGLPLAVFALLLAVGLFIFGRSPEQIARLLRPPPLERFEVSVDYDWRLQRLDGSPMSLRELKGRVVVLNFWATWCPPCLAELPSLQRLHESVQGEGIVVLGVSDEELPTVRKYLARKGKGIDFPMAVREGPAPQAFAHVGLPATFVISADGRVVARHQGAAVWDTPETLRLLRSLQSRPPAAR